MVKRCTLCLTFWYRSAGESNKLIDNKESGERDVGKKSCNAQVHFHNT